MSDEMEFDLASLDDVRTTPPDVRERILERLTSAELKPAPSASHVHSLTEYSEEGDESVDVVVTLDRSNAISPRRKRPAFVAAAAAAVVLLALAAIAVRERDEVPLASSPFPSARAEAACASLTTASEDFILLALNGDPAIDIDRLEPLRDAVQAFADTVESEGVETPATLEQWASAADGFAQAADQLTAGAEFRAQGAVELARDAFFQAAQASDSPTAEACLGDWAKNPFLGERPELINPDG